MADARAVLFQSTLPTYTVAERSGKEADWLAATCPRADCGLTFLLDRRPARPTAPCPHCSRVARWPDGP